MKESIFQGELKNSIIEEGGWCEKFPDGIRTKETRFIPSKPADLIAVVDQKPILIECKIIKEIKNIRPHFFGNTKERKEKIHWSEYHQVKELAKFHKQGCRAYYAINLRIPRKENQLFFLPISWFFSYFSKNEMIEKCQLLLLASDGITGKKKRFKGITKKL